MKNSNISFFCVINSIIIAIFFFSCANPQPPSGGPPDKTPPEIIEVFPANQTINFDKRTVLLRFSKYMDKGKVLENIFISPNVQATYSWSGKVLEISLPEDIDTSITYSISLGTEYTDLYNNKPAQAFSLIFSAGSKIDSGYIAGKVYDKKPDGAYIYTYILDNINPDTLNPANTKPDYRIQLGTSGEFRIPALKDATYRFFAIRDQFRNELYEPVDAFGTSIHDIKVLKSKSEPVVLKIGPPIDDTGPMVNEATAIFNNYIRVTFNEPVNPDFIFPESFEIKTEDKSKSAEIISAAIHYENKSRIEIITRNPLDTGFVWNVTCLKELNFAIRDTIGNFVNDSLNIGKFRAVTDIDTNAVALLFLSLKDSSEFVPVKPEIDLIFSKSIDTNGANISIELINSETMNPVDISYRVLGSNIKITPDKQIPDSKWFKISASLKNIKSFSNKSKIDTTISVNFKTLDLKIKGNVSGIVDFEKEICDFNKYIILRHSNGRDIYTSELGQNNEWIFNNIETGDYTAEVYCDVDGNGKYSYGQIYPFKFSEPFVVFEDIMNIKPRWTLENVILKVKDTHAH